MKPELWSLVGQFIALLAIPHAVAQALPKLISVSNRPSLAVAAKTMEAAAYVTLAVVSALLIQGYRHGASQHPSPAEVDAAHQGITLGLALDLYLPIYGTVLTGLAAIVIAVRTALHTQNHSRYKAALFCVGIMSWVCWVGLLDRVSRSIDIVPSNHAAIAALMFGPPLLVVGSIAITRAVDRRRTATNATTDPAETELINA